MKDEEVLKMCSEFPNILSECKERIFETFDKYGFDAAFFNINIHLSVRVNGIVIQCKEKWKALEP